MRDGKILHCVLFCLCLLVVCLSARAEEKLLFRADFASLEQWRPVHFPNIKKHTDYSVETRGQEHYLRGESKASASAPVYRHEFSPYEYPRVRWRWKVDNLYEKAQPGAKSGDDYPMRVYIVFKYDPAAASFLEKVKYETMRVLYGEYPPHSSLTYVWSSKVDDKKIHESPYTSKARVIDQLLYRHWVSWKDGRFSHVLLVPSDGSAAPRDRRRALLTFRRSRWADPTTTCSRPIPRRADRLRSPGPGLLRRTEVPPMRSAFGR